MPLLIEERAQEGQRSAAWTWTVGLFAWRMDQIPGLLPVFRGEASLRRMRLVPGLEACGVEGRRRRAGILGEGCATQPGSQPGQRPACPGDAAPSGGSRSQVPQFGMPSKKEHLLVRLCASPPGRRRPDFSTQAV